LLLLLFLLVLIYYLRKRREEHIIPAFDTSSQKNPSEQTAVNIPIDSHTSHDSHDSAKPPSPEITPDPFADLAPSTPVLAMLYGKVTDREGHDLPEVLVSVYSDEPLCELEVLSSCITDKQGNYSFKNLPVTHYRVLATKPGYYLEYEYISFHLGMLSIEQNFQMSSGGLSLAGTVQDKEGRVVDQASLLLNLTESSLFLGEKSDDKGCFRFDGLSSESACLTVSAPGFASFSQIPAIIGKEDMRIILSRDGGTRIKGKVLYTDTKELAPEATIIIERQIGSNVNRSSLFFTAKADEKGDYETVSLTPGRYNLWASAMSFGEGSDMKKEITIFEDAALEIWMDLFLPVNHDIRGWVVDAENRQPVPGALVRTIHFPPKTVQTDPQGRFRILDNGRLMSRTIINLSAQAPGYASAFKTIRNISDNIPPVEMKLRKTACVYGTIYSSSGEPVSHVNWMISDGYAQYNGKGYNPPTDEQGRYLYYMPTDWLGKKVYICAYSPKYGFGYDAFSLSGEPGEITKDLTLSPGVKVTVMVLDKQGEGIKDCQIMCKTYKENEFAMFNSIETDVEGCAVFENLPRSVFTFYTQDFRRKLFKTKSLDLSSADSPQEIVFSLDEPEEATRVVYGRVTNEQGNPIKDVVVGMELLNEVLTNAEGFYRIESNSGYMKEHSVSFSKEGYELDIQSIDQDKKEIQLDVVLKKQNSLVFFGTITSRKGNFPTEADIEICTRDENNSVWVLCSRLLSLKQGGRFEYNLDPIYHYQPESTYFIRARDYVYGSGCSKEIKDEGNGSIGPFEIALSWATLKGFLRDGKSGNTVSHALISIIEINRNNYDCFETSARGSGTYTKSDENGYFELSPVPSGSSEIYFYHPEYWIQKKNSPEITQENLEKEWNPALDPCSSIEGRILNSDGTPLISSEVSIYSTASYRNNLTLYSSSIETNEQGYYKLTGIPLGEYGLSLYSTQAHLIYSCLMKRKTMTFTEPEQRTLDIHLPETVPAIFQIKNYQTIFLEPLFPAEYTKLTIYLSPEFSGNDCRVLLPLGRYRMQIENTESPPKEIEIYPFGETRIIIEEEKK